MEISFVSSLLFEEEFSFSVSFKESIEISFVSSWLFEEEFSFKEFIEISFGSSWLRGDNSSPSSGTDSVSSKAKVLLTEIGGSAFILTIGGGGASG